MGASVYSADESFLSIICFIRAITQLSLPPGLLDGVGLLVRGESRREPDRAYQPPQEGALDAKSRAELVRVSSAPCVSTGLLIDAPLARAQVTVTATLCPAADRTAFAQPRSDEL